MHTYYLRLAGLWLITTLALAGNAALAAEPRRTEAKTAAPPKAASIVKWVDEKGVTHYGDSVPAQYSNRDNSELDRQGRVVKRNKASDPQAGKAAEEAKANVEQRRHDRALLAAYTSEQEFDLARDRNLQTDEATVEGLNQQMAGAKTRLAATKKNIDGLNKRKKPIPPYVSQDLKSHQDEIAKIETQIAERQQSMEATRQRFEKDKQRYIELKLNPNAPPPATAPVVAAPAPDPAKTTPAPAAPEAPVAPAPTATAAPAAPTKPAESAATTKTEKKKKRVIMQ